MYKGFLAMGCGRNLCSPSVTDEMWSQCVPLPRCDSRLLLKLKEAFGITVKLETLK
jgi:hypothetical protein